MSGFDVVLLNSRRPFARSNSKGRALPSANRADCVRPRALPTKSLTLSKKKCPKIFGEVAVLELRRFRHRNHERETPSRKKRPSKRTPVASSNPAKHPVRTQTSLRDARRLATASAASKKSLEKIRESFPLPIPVEGVFGGIDCPQSTFQHFFFLFIWGPGPVGSAPLPLPPSPGRRGPGAWDPALAG